MNSIAGATIRKRGLGTVNLVGNNTALNSAVTVAEGSLGVLNSNALNTGTITATVSAGASIDLIGTLTVAAPLTLNGTGPNGTGALRDLSGTSTLNGNISLAGNATVLVFAGGLTLNGNVTGNTLTKIGTADLTLGGAGANTSNVTVAQGRIVLNKTTVDTNAAGTLTIGDDIGGDNVDVVQIAAAAAVRQSVTNLTVTSSGLMDINAKQFIVTGTVTLGIGQTSSGDIQTGAGVLVLGPLAGGAGGGNITVQIQTGVAGNTAATTAAPAATITGNVNLNDGQRTITVTDHASGNSLANNNSILAVRGNDDLLVTALVTSTTPASGSLIVAGTGRLALTASNTFSGGVTINSGPIVAARQANALGTGGTVTVNGGGTLEFDGALGTINAGLSLSLNGAGATDLVAAGVASRTLGALRLMNANATVTFPGPITVAGAAAIHADLPTDTLLLSGGINLNGQTLTVEGGGIVNVTAASSGNGNVVVDFATLQLSGNGTLSTGAAGQTITLQSGGTLNLDNTGTAVADRVADTAAINLNNGRLLFRGNAGTAVTEVIGAVNLTAGFGSVIQMDRTGANLNLTAASLNRGAGSSVRFVATGADIGTASNQLIFTAAPPRPTGSSPGRRSPTPPANSTSWSRRRAGPPSRPCRSRRTRPGASTASRRRPARRWCTPPARPTRPA